MNSNYHQSNFPDQNSIIRDKNHIDIGSKNLDENMGSGPYCVECAGTGSTLENEPCARCEGTGGAGGSIVFIFELSVILIGKIAGRVKNIGIGMGLMKVFGWPVAVGRKVIKGKKKNRERREAERARQQRQNQEFE